MAILVVANQKGGVGKTTTAINLAAGICRRGKKVLLVDLDIQGSASAALGVRPGDDNNSVADCLIHERQIEHVVRETTTEGLFLAPAGESLATVDIHLASAMGREGVLQRTLSTVTDKVDHVVIDTAPYLGLLTLNALVAADHLLVPVSCEYLPMLGLKLFAETMERMRTRLGVRCDVLGYVLTMYDKRERITSEVEAILRRNFGPLVFSHPIRINTHHKAAPSHKKTIFDYETASGKGRQDYERLVDEVLQRMRHAARSANLAARP